MQMFIVEKILEKYPRNYNDSYGIICYTNSKQYRMHCDNFEKIVTISYDLKDKIQDFIVDGKKYFGV